MTANSPYPPISDYGYISDCHSSALVSKDGSIDWCCLPRFDSGSCFGRILDWKKGGYCRIRPVGRYQVSRRYLPHTLVLETVFKNENGEVRLLDCITMRRGGEHHPHQQILRIVEGIRGTMKLSVDVVPVFDYGEIQPWIRKQDEYYLAIGGNNGLLISGDFPLTMKHRHHLECEWSSDKDQRGRLSILWRPPEDLDENMVDPPDIRDLDDRLNETIQWWEKVVRPGRPPGQICGHSATVGRDSQGARPCAHRGDRSRRHDIPP